MSAQLPELVAAGADDAEQALAVASCRHGVTHLHAHFASMATTVARLAALVTDLPYSFTAHAKDIFHRDVEDEDLARKLRDADHAVTISEYNRRHLSARFGRRARRPGSSWCATVSSSSSSPSGSGPCRPRCRTCWAWAAWSRRRASTI